MLVQEFLCHFCLDWKTLDERHPTPLVCSECNIHHDTDQMIEADDKRMAKLVDAAHVLSTVTRGVDVKFYAFIRSGSIGMLQTGLNAFLKGDDAWRLKSVKVISNSSPVEERFKITGEGAITYASDLRREVVEESVISKKELKSFISKIEGIIGEKYDPFSDELPPF